MSPFLVLLAHRRAQADVQRSGGVMIVSESTRGTHLTLACHCLAKCLRVVKAIEVSPEILPSRATGQWGTRFLKLCCLLGVTCVIDAAWVRSMSRNHRCFLESAKIGSGAVQGISCSRNELPASSPTPIELWFPLGNQQKACNYGC